ncbi:MAG TPA: alkaline phosphatase family protein [Bacteroidales bacterium]|nr:alkaline phosphatase family protein [Bacteroidales bacterium]
MKKLLTSVLGLLTVSASGLPLQAEDLTPRLVIGIHINQLDENYLEWFMNGFEEDGFRKVLQNSAHYTNMVYASSHPDNATACASFMTGSTPRLHGITAARWYDRTTDKQVSCILDPRYLGNYTQDMVSPKNLHGSTLGDELKRASNNEAKVFSIGIDAEEAILLGGHSADGVFWLDDSTGKWCTSTYYNYIPWWLQNINDQENMGQMVEQTTWTPLKPMDYYRFMPHQPSPTLFKNLYNKAGRSKFSQFKESPMMNSEVLRIALQTIEKEQLGRDGVTDYLVIQLSADTKSNNQSLSPIEIQDIYFRLDQEIGKLLKATEKTVGNENIRMYITGTGEPVLPAIDVPKEKAYTGDFYPDRCTSLLNLYLMALYGNDQWVSAWDHQAIFLNRKKIEEKGLHLNEVRQKATEFLSEFSGVRQAYPYTQLLLGTANAAISEQANAIYTERAADIYLDIQGGWNVRENSAENDYQIGSGAFSTPFIYYNPDQKGQTIETPVSAGDINASLSRIFRIRPPTSNQGYALPELK